MHWGSLIGGLFLMKNSLLQVAADDIDEGENGEVAYTNIMRDNNSLQIDNKSGWITVKTNMHIFDRESAKGKQQFETLL
jgi:hypothetical protein